MFKMSVHVPTCMQAFLFVPLYLHLLLKFVFMLRPCTLRVLKSHIIYY